MRFEIRYFFFEIGLSPSGLTQFQEKECLVSDLILYFRFRRACVRYSTVRATVYIYTAIHTEFCSILKGGWWGVGVKIPLLGQSQGDTVIWSEKKNNSNFFNFIIIIISNSLPPLKNTILSWAEPSSAKIRLDVRMQF